MCFLLFYNCKYLLYNLLAFKPPLAENRERGNIYSYAYARDEQSMAQRYIIFVYPTRKIYFFLKKNDEYHYLLEKFITLYP